MSPVCACVHACVCVCVCAAVNSSAHTAWLPGVRVSGQAGSAGVPGSHPERPRQWAALPSTPNHKHLLAGPVPGPRFWPFQQRLRWLDLGALKDSLQTKLASGQLLNQPLITALSHSLTHPSIHSPLTRSVTHSLIH
jgi:hypothetical protein